LSKLSSIRYGDLQHVKSDGFIGFHIDKSRANLSTLGDSATRESLSGIGRLERKESPGFKPFGPVPRYAAF
jgi:hypothetical protein